MCVSCKIASTEVTCQSLAMWSLIGRYILYDPVYTCKQLLFSAVVGVIAAIMHSECLLRLGNIAISKREL